MTAPLVPLRADPIPWRGLIHGVQPRIDLMRSFDQRSHTYLGYLVIAGSTRAPMTLAAEPAAGAAAWP